MLNNDYRDMLECLLEENVEFLLVGAYAVAVHGHPRATKDMDIWVWANPNNAARVYRALKRFYAPMHQVQEHDFATKGVVFQIGVSPRRIDVTTVIDGVEFPDAYGDRVEVELDGLSVPVISKPYLIANKRASGRPQDLVDADNLERSND